MRGDINNNTAYPDSFYDLFEKSHNQTHTHTDLKSYIGNQASVDVKIIIVDNTDPVISVIGDTDLTLEASKYKKYTDDGAICSDHQTNALFKATSSISLAQEAKYLGTPPTGTWPETGAYQMTVPSGTTQSQVTYNCANCKYTITYTCPNGNNNLTRTVTVRDTRKPDLAIRQPTRYAELGTSDPSDNDKLNAFDENDIVAQDNLGNVTFVGATVKNSDWPRSYQINYEYKDQNENSANVTRTVFWRDTELPVINLTLGQLTSASDNNFPNTDTHTLAIAPAQGNVWMFAAIASAVTGVAMFSLHYVRRSPSIEV